MLKTKKEKIGEYTYTCTQMNATDAIRMQFKIGKFIADPLAKVFVSDDESGKVKGLAELLKNIDDDDFYDIYIKLISSCFRVGKDGKGALVDIDADFSGNLKEAFLVFIFAFKVNFADFLEGAAGIFGGEIKI